MHSVACVGFKVNFLDSFSSNCVVIITLFITITSDVLIKIFKNLIISISYMQFSRYIDDNEDSLSSGEYEIRTRDLLLARQALSQLS